MLGFIGAVVVVFISVGIVHYLCNVYCATCGKCNLTKKLSENDLVKKFNKIVKNLTDRNLMTVKTELLDILEEYREIKCNEFIESKVLLENSINSLESQLTVLKERECELLNSISIIKNEIDNNTCSSDSLDFGSRFMYELEKLQETKKSLEDSIINIKQKISIIDNNVNLFNHKYVLKKSEITLMIANAISINNVSDVDLKLNDLVLEFKEKAREGEIKKDITEKVYNGTSSLNKRDEGFDKDTYIEKLKSFKCEVD